MITEVGNKKILKKMIQKLLVEKNILEQKEDRFGYIVNPNLFENYATLFDNIKNLINLICQIKVKIIIRLNNIDKVINEIVRESKLDKNKGDMKLLISEFIDENINIDFNQEELKKNFNSKVKEFYDNSEFNVAKLKKYILEFINEYYVHLKFFDVNIKKLQVQIGSEEAKYSNLEGKNILQLNLGIYLKLNFIYIVT